MLMCLQCTTVNEEKCETRYETVTEQQCSTVNEQQVRTDRRYYSPVDVLFFIIKNSLCSFFDYPHRLN